jgi:hypothetical protein
MATEQTVRDVSLLVGDWQRELERVLDAPPPHLASHAILVPAGSFTEADAKRAAQQIAAPVGWDFEREPDGTVEVWGRDLFEGHYWQVFARAAAPTA